MTPAQQLALWADKLRDISALGLHFAQNIYDREHYQAVQNMAVAMLAYATGSAVDEMEPLRAQVFARPTPLVVGDAAIIDADGRMLLIQRADNGLWAMPGGAFEVGETPAAGAVREALEETGVCAEPVALAGVFDSRLCGSATRHHLYQFVFLCRPTGAPASVPSHQHETRQQGWFLESELPTKLDPGHATRIPIVFQVWRGERGAYFDQLSTQAD
ncbi:MAG: NUDIX hydrolase N-terminal domain-containing protein [Caldilineaceae bacterium]|nr:NUDIX hydrolase N-terminal domain-containing protein [Caldilineaceae bacterium]